MHPIDTTYAQDGKFVDVSPPTVQGTVCSAAWLNAVQGEILNVVAAGGLAPDKNDNTQLLQAFQKMSGGPGAGLPNPYGLDEQNPADDDVNRQTVVLKAGADCVTWNSVLVQRSGVAWRVFMKLKTSGASTTNIDLRVLYVLEPEDGSNPVVKERRQADKAYILGDKIVPPLAALNGFYYVCTTAGTSGSTAPTFGTTPGGYTADGSTLVWQCGPGGLAALSSLVAPPGVAFQRFDLDDADYTIPLDAAGAGDRLHVGFFRRGASDANPDDLHLESARIYAVEV